MSKLPLFQELALYKNSPPAIIVYFIINDHIVQYYNILCKNCCCDKWTSPLFIDLFLL